VVKKQENTGTLMKSSLIFAVLVALSPAAASTTALHAEEEDTKEHFAAFVSQFNKKYADADEYQPRFSAFKHNLAQIEAFRAKYGVPLPSQAQVPPEPTLGCLLISLQEKTQFVFRVMT
jgi:hypothetical protein